MRQRLKFRPAIITPLPALITPSPVNEFPNLLAANVPYNI